MSKSVLAWVALLLVVAGATAVALALKYRAAQASYGVAAPEVDEEYLKVPASGNEKWLTEYALTERSGRRVGTAELKGKVHVVSFFFATCPGPCLTQNMKLDELHQAYGPRGVQFVSITCDPENDTPTNLREYASRRFPSAGSTWWFLTGDLLYIRRIAGEIYQVALDRQTHIEAFLVVDKWGNTRGIFHWKEPAELFDMRRLLDKLLAETSPPLELAEKAKSKTPSATTDDPPAAGELPAALPQGDLPDP
jgi:cytochrome oxidase Cu insertion factor (SCO1/SenC/PrrC family)